VLPEDMNRSRSSAWQEPTVWCEHLGRDQLLRVVGEQFRALKCRLHEWLRLQLRRDPPKASRVCDDHVTERDVSADASAGSGRDDQLRVDLVDQLLPQIDHRNGRTVV